MNSSAHLGLVSKISPSHASSVRCVKVPWRIQWHWSCRVDWPRRKSCCSSLHTPLPALLAPASWKQGGVCFLRESWAHPGHAKVNEQNCGYRYLTVCWFFFLHIHTAVHLVDRATTVFSVKNRDAGYSSICMCFLLSNILTDYLVNFPDPTVNAIKWPTIGDVIHKQDALVNGWQTSCFWKT